MRTTTLMSLRMQTDRLLRGDERLQDARERVSSGVRLARPSDAPCDMARMLELTSRSEHADARREALTVAQPAMEASESALGEISSAIGQVRTLALQAANATTSSEHRLALADQVSALRTRILDLANSRFGGAYLFAGVATDMQPFDAGPPTVYVGSADARQTEVADGQMFATSLTGAQLAAAGGSDLFAALGSLEDAVRAGSADGTAAGIDSLEAAGEDVTRMRADMGARMQYIRFTADRAAEEVDALASQVSDLRDVDLAEAVLEEQTAENAQQAVLLMAGRLGAPSLVDYLT